MGVTFSQVSFTFVGGEGDSARASVDQVANSDTGELRIDLAAVRAATGLDSGFLNVRTAQGWVVQNVPLLAGLGFPGLAVSLQIQEECCEDVTFITAACT
jgi:hypothetical protein